jgi:tetratricopeptide (TPR) repeat protein
MRLFIGLLVGICLMAQDSLKPAEELYQKTEYRASLGVLQHLPSQNAAGYALAGRDYFMLGEFKKASEAFQRAFAQEPGKSEYAHWLGRAFGRRAEMSNWFSAPGLASKARQYFEQAVVLDPQNGEAMNDLFDFYLQAPGFLGGGYDKAQALAQRIAAHNTAEGHFALAQLADKRKQYDTAEDQLRRAMEVAPREIGRVLDLAKYLAKHGRIEDSEAAFDRAERLAPHAPKVFFARANFYIQQKRNLEQARTLLKKYLQSNLSPDDPPREESVQLLKQAAGS